MSYRNYWNYFLAINDDIEKLTRYIEFEKSNFSTYSIELTRLLLSVSSEIDVILKDLCNKLDPTINHKNINDYRTTIKSHMPAIIGETIYIYGYDLEFRPWFAWRGNHNPKWWRSYNKVKHQRNSAYKKANLENTLKAVSALLIIVTYYCKKIYEDNTGETKTMKNTIYGLNLGRKIISLNADYYPKFLMLES